MKNSEAKATKLSLDSIRLDAGTQTRAHIDDATVAEYAEAMARGDRFPPVIVYQNAGEFIMADGFHRAKAARRARLKRIPAEIRRGSRRDALRFALAANHKHGLRRSNRDKRCAVEMALAEFGNCSDHLLGQMCGVSQTFVSNLRHQLKTVFSSPRRLGRDGKLRALPSGASGADDLKPSLDEPSTDHGVLSSGNGHEAFVQLADALASLESLVERVVQEHPENRPAVRAAISKVRRDLLNLDRRIAAAQHAPRKATR